jgi:hypothetical protein
MALNLFASGQLSTRAFIGQSVSLVAGEARLIELKIKRAHWHRNSALNLISPSRISSSRYVENLASHDLNANGNTIFQFACVPGPSMATPHCFLGGGDTLERPVPISVV